LERRRRPQGRRGDIEGSRSVNRPRKSRLASRNSCSAARFFSLTQTSGKAYARAGWGTGQSGRCSWLLRARIPTKQQIAPNREGDRKISRFAAAIGVLAMMVAGSGVASAATASKCSGGKVKNAGKKAAAKLTCLSKAVGKSLAAPDSTCV